MFFFYESTANLCLVPTDLEQSYVGHSVGNFTFDIFLKLINVLCLTIDEVFTNLRQPPPQPNPREISIRVDSSVCICLVKNVDQSWDSVDLLYCHLSGGSF